MKYSIDEEGIFGLSSNDRFSISELKNGKGSEEKLRICIEPISDNIKSQRKFYFKKENHGYKWTFCTLDLRFVENDTLKNLSLEHKLEILKKENPNIGEIKKYDTIPIQFTPGTWYHFFGLDDIEGSYFVYVRDDKTFRVEYYEGPF